MDIREYIRNNFKNDDESAIEKAIIDAIETKAEEPLIGMGVLFETLWINADEDLKKQILSILKRAL